MVLDITKDNFETEVMQSDKPVLLDFWAAWCGPCRMIAPDVEEIAGEHPEIKVGRINIDEEMELAMKYNVIGVPMLVYIKDGEVKKKSIGAIPKESIEEIIEK